MIEGAQKRQCGKKTAYPDGDTAVLEINARVGRDRQSKWSWYWCPWCGHVHIGRDRTLAGSIRRSERSKEKHSGKTQKR